MKKLFCLMVVAIMAISLVSCATQETVADTYVAPKADPNELVPSSVPLKPVDGAKISILIGDIGRTKWNQDIYLIKEWAKHMGNAQITIIPVSKTEVSQKLATMIASKSLPDMFNLAASPVPFSKQYGMKGIFYPINKKLNQMPNTLKMIQKYPDYTKIMRADDGNIYGMPYVADYNFFTTSMLISPRVEEELGVKPTDITDMNKLLDVLKQWKNKYPDSYPFLTRHGDTDCLLMYAYKTGAGFYLNGDTDTIKYGPADTSYHDMIKFLATCYKEGLMHPDYATMNESVWRELFASEKGIFTIDNLSQAQQIAKNVNDPAQAFIPILAPKVNGTQGYSSANRGNISPDQGCWIFKANSPYIDNMLEFADWAMSDKGAMFFQYGNEGETWEYAAPGLYSWRTPAQNPDATHIWAEHPNETRDTLGLGQATYMFRSLPVSMMFGQYMIYSRTAGFNKVPAKQITDNNLKNYNMIKNAPNAIAPLLPQVPMTTDENMRVKQIQNQVDTIVLEYAAKMIKGQLDVDKDWDAFQAKLNSFHYQEALDIYNRAYQRYKKY